MFGAPETKTNGHATIAWKPELDAQDRTVADAAKRRDAAVAVEEKAAKAEQDAEARYKRTSAAVDTARTVKDLKGAREEDDEAIVALRQAAEFKSKAADAREKAEAELAHALAERGAENERQCRAQIEVLRAKVAEHVVALKPLLDAQEKLGRNFVVLRTMQIDAVNHACAEGGFRLDEILGWLR